MQKNLPTPISVTIPTIIVLFITSWFGVRTYAAIANWQILVEFGANPAYILGTGVFWTLTGLWMIAIIWRRKPYASQANSISAGIFILWYWFDRLVMQSTPALNGFFSLAISTLGLAVFIICLNIPASKSFFNME